MAYPSIRAIVIPPEITSAARGRQRAQDLGCFTCHGPLGRGGVTNPGSQYGTVPSFHEGTIMMFAKSDDDLREYILDGAPAAKLESEAYAKEMSGQALRMPAYRDQVSQRDVEDMVAFLRSTSELLFPPDGPATDGEELAHELGCFICHGAMGSGGIANPGSLKGYIPGFYGPDFAELVRDDEELRSWIRNGGIKRLAEDSLASYFLERQRVQMPAYGGYLKDDQIAALVAYVKWVSEESWRGMPLQ
jgi:mono/diheme cytochrome c family protein